MKPGPKPNTRGKVHYIYALCDENDVRYVGMSTDPERRKLCATSYRFRYDWAIYLWTRERREQNPKWKPTLIILEELDGWDKTAEAKWITRFIELGCELTNHVLDGGSGGLPLSEEGRRNCSESGRRTQQLLASRKVGQ